ncbi:MAG: hypothetical protein U5L04_16075 [Trueperaceae bacterium]|nr:hypothetical protein [Trueperaceae bacterium]
MASQSNRARRRRWTVALYIGLYVLTLIGVGQGEPRLWGIPAWYLWAGSVLVLLVALNVWFVRYCWPSEEPLQGPSLRGGGGEISATSAQQEVDR